MPLQWCQSTHRPIDVTYRHRCSRRRHFRGRWRSKKRNNIPFLEENESHSYYDAITAITNTVVAAIGTTRAVMRAAKTIPDRVLLYDEHACDEAVVVKMVAPPPATEYTNKRFDPYVCFPLPPLSRRTIGLLQWKIGRAFASGFQPNLTYPIRCR